MNISQPFSDDDVQYCKKILKEFVSAERFAHSLSVADMMCELDETTPQNTALVLSLYHDLTHEWDRDKHLSLIEENNLYLYDGEEDITACLHAVTSSFLFSSHFTEKDDIYSFAIRHHTVLTKESANDLCLTLYIADKIERRRKYLNSYQRDIIIGETNIEKRVMFVLEDQQRFLKKDGKSLLPCTKEYLNDLKIKYPDFKMQW